MKDEVAMSQFENNAFFWQKLDTLYFSSSIVITQPSGSAHPQYGNLIYPVDYGYLTDTLSQDETGISIYKGTLSANQVNTIIIAADILKKDIEVKFLVGCSVLEEEAILRFTNQTDFQKTILLRRGMEVPSWGFSEQ
jgi:inorganic pyrophosphatase